MIADKKKAPVPAHPGLNLSAFNRSRLKAG
jgi:hypothetical protein